MTWLAQRNFIVDSVPVDEKTMRPKEPGGINGGIMKKNDLVPGPTFSIKVENIDTAIEKIKKAGGTIIHDKSPVANIGLVAYFKDPEGNVLSVWQDVG